MQVTVDIPDELARELERQNVQLTDFIGRELRHLAGHRTSALDEVVAFLNRQPSPEQILAYRPSDQSVARLEQLLDRNREGSLNPAEEAELDTLQTLNDLFNGGLRFG